MLPNDLAGEGPEELFPRAQFPIPGPTGHSEPSEKQLVDEAMEAGRSQMAAIVLHNIGNAITPIRVHLEHMRGKQFLQVTEYLEKCFRDLEAHGQDLQRYIQEDPRGKEVFSYLGELIGAVKMEEERRAQILQRMDEAVSYIAEILTLQKGYAANAKESRTPVDLNALVEDALRLQAAALEKRKITVQRELEPDLPRILIEKNRLMQVILNLVKNSCEAMDGQDDPQRPNEIRVRSHTENGKTHLEISDNGVGIAPENIPKIGTFGLSTKGSSGFGLFYCKMFVEAHHGTLLIRSEGIGKGTSIVMCFPVAPGNI